MLDVHVPPFYYSAAFVLALVACVAAAASPATAQDAEPRLILSNPSIDVYVQRKEAGLGAQGVGWVVRNKTGDSLEVSLEKTYFSTSGRELATRSSGHIYIEPNETVVGGRWVGDDIGLWDDFFFGDEADEMRKGERIGRIAVEVKVRNLTAERRARAEEEAARRREQEAEQRRIEEERRRIEADQRAAEEAERAREAAREAEERRVEEEREAEERRAEALRERARAREAAADSARAATGAATAAVGGLAMLAIADNTAEFQGTSWHVRASGAMVGIGFPLWQNHQGSAIYPYTSNSDALTLGPRAQLDLWPVYGLRYGIGVTGSLTVGVMASEDGASMSSGMMSSIGVMGYVGDGTFNLLVEGSRDTRSGSSSFDGATYGVDATGYGEAEYDVSRLAIGTRIGSHDGAVELLVFRETVSYVPDQKMLGLTVRLDGGPVWLIGEYAPGYPIAGTAEYPLHQDSEEEGAYFSIGVGFSFRRFGAPYTRAAPPASPR